MSRSGGSHQPFAHENRNHHIAQVHYSSLRTIVPPSQGAGPAASSSGRTVVASSPTRPATRTQPPALLSPRSPLDVLDDDELYSPPPLSSGPVIPPPVVRNAVRNFLCLCETSLTHMKYFEALLHVSQLAQSSLGFVPPSTPSVLSTIAPSLVGPAVLPASDLTSLPSVYSSHDPSRGTRKRKRDNLDDRHHSPPRRVRRLDLPRLYTASEYAAAQGLTLLATAPDRDPPSPVTSSAPPAAEPSASAHALPFLTHMSHSTSVTALDASSVPVPSATAPLVYQWFSIAGPSVPSVAAPFGATPFASTFAGSSTLPLLANPAGIDNRYAYYRNPATNLFVCPKCPYTHHSAASLSGHYRSHLGAKKVCMYRMVGDSYVCPYSACRWSTKGRSKMARHVLLHTAGLWCALCSTTYETTASCHVCDGP